MTTQATETTEIVNVKRRSGDWLESGPRPMRSLKIEDELWDALTALSAERNVSRSRLIRTVLAEWVAKNEKKGAT